MEVVVDWKRLGKFVFQECRRLGTDNAETVLQRLREIAALCGETTSGRQSLIRLAVSLIKTDCKPQVLAACCPDYTNDDGKYTFRGLRGGVSLLTSLHITFLKQLALILPEASVTILIADQEADDPTLCQVCGKTRDEFLALVYESIAETDSLVRDQGWQVRAFTEYMPELLEQERAISKSLLATPELARRLMSEARDREGLYRRIRVFQFEEMMERTARTAAQYLALGRRVQSKSGILVNHTTTNLKWYAETEVAVLHNPVCVY